MRESFLDFFRKWWAGPLGLTYVYREVFIALGDPRDSVPKERGVYSLEGALLEVGRHELREMTLMLGIGFVRPELGYVDELSPDSLLYDRIVFDFDNEEDPQFAIDTARVFARRLREDYGAGSLVVVTGFKGAHVVIPLKPVTDWEGLKLLWRGLMMLLKPWERGMVDHNMLQFNRVHRVPYTYNIKGGEARRTVIIEPSTSMLEFDWSAIEPLKPSNVEVPVFEAPSAPKVLRPTRRRGSYKWVERVIAAGLPDGRKRFILYTLTPYLANVAGVGEREAFEAVRSFLEASCVNHGACEKVYDSWVRSAFRGAKRKGLLPRSLKSWAEKDPQVYSLIQSVLKRHKKRPTGSYVEVFMEFVKETERKIFTYDDFKRWLEARLGRQLTASEWQGWERRLRDAVVRHGMLGREFFVNGEWVDYGTEEVKSPPSRRVRFYRR